ncbi:hypothetical protein [Mesorhizobium sp.]|uniref:hypothetical protein n=1 Tax=Mesorhizobium sp. TaxID=1871066 RepID=UPI000FE75C47|nr:hypothetical protein [Mesorhizobium sp.]RWK44448.1 MAG: hypothetical protein EOR46_00565 [Mesorhizobium sp.]RWK71534.1 MAG: hypothetical protein EOR54_01320 [Mesorhizobium sp.]RWK82002.1 MAG: hypothetical protein EOR50_01250 [Mesorhizobium sp.]RWK82970.1 MAG: hypothetical protein EOR51_10090 [Mesorhizobium sp.]RWL09521.1 MAG: hypothetical protein EOR55_01240 [Mesorhizobium sp.]
MINKHPYIVAVVSGALFGATAMLAAIAVSAAPKVATDSTSLTSADLSAFGGAIVGAIVGGVIAYFLQMSALRAQKSEREQKDRQERQALAHALVFKMLSMVNNFAHFKLHVEECQSRVIAASGHTENPATYLLPIINLPMPVQLESAEMGMLLSLGDDRALNSVLEAAPIHNSILPAWAEYAVLRSEINAMMPPLIDMATGIGEVAFQQGSPVAVKFFEANQMAQQLIERATRDFAEASDTLKALVMLLRNKLGLKVSIGDVPARSASDVTA